MPQKPTVNRTNHGDLHEPMGVTVPVPIRVWCSWMWVWVDKKKPKSHPCHALSMGSPKGGGGPGTALLGNSESGWRDYPEFPPHPINFLGFVDK